MELNQRVVDFLKNCPKEHRKQYERIFKGEDEEVEVPQFYTVQELLEQVKDKPLVRTTDTGWDELNRATTGGIADGESVLLAAQAGAGKTHFSVNMAINYARQGLDVCYLTMEDGWELILNRFKAMDKEGFSKHHVFMVHEDELTLKNAAKIIEKAAQDAKLIIVDNLFALPLRQGSVGDYWTSQAEWVDDICNIIRSSESSVLICHHLNKSQNTNVERYQIAGSTRIVNRVSQVWLMSRTQEAPDTIAIKIEKNRRSPMKNELWLKSDHTGLLRSVDPITLKTKAIVEARSIFNV